MPGNFFLISRNLPAKAESTFFGDYVSDHEMVVFEVTERLITSFSVFIFLSFR
jgi:hypothetical protein